MYEIKKVASVKILLDTDTRKDSIKKLRKEIERKRKKYCNFN